MKVGVNASRPDAWQTQPDRASDARLDNSIKSTRADHGAVYRDRIGAEVSAI
jgi:hypothetical protein